MLGGGRFDMGFYSVGCLFIFSIFSFLLYGNEVVFFIFFLLLGLVLGFYFYF